VIPVTQQKRPEGVLADTAPAMRADARRNRQKVLRAGRRCLADDGLDAQMEDIARRAKVGIGTVYRHFLTKDELVEALAAERFKGLTEKAREALGNPNPWAGFADFMHYSASLQANDRALSEIMGARPEMMSAAAEDSGLFEPLSELVAKAQQAGTLRPDVVPEDVPMLVCGLARAPRRGSKGPEMNWERYLGIVLDGLRAPAITKLPPPRS
jgi:AcrR family transcriptional regulator